MRARELGSILLEILGPPLTQITKSKGRRRKEKSRGQEPQNLGLPYLPDTVARKKLRAPRETPAKQFF